MKHLTVNKKQEQNNKTQDNDKLQQSKKRKLDFYPFNGENICLENRHY